MAGTVDVGTGTTLTLATSSWSIEITDLQINDITRALINTHHMGTTGAITKRTGDLYDPGSFTVQIHFDPDEEAPYSGVEETATITFPVPSGLTNGATLIATAACTSFSGSIPLEDKMTGRAVFSFTDDLAWADAT